VVFRVVCKGAYTDKDTARIGHELGEKLRIDIQLEVACVDEIPKTSREKHRFLEQKLGVQYEDR
jgi:hypothetical protein